MVPDLRAVLDALACVSVDHRWAVLGKELACECVDEDESECSTAENEDCAGGLDGSSGDFLARFELGPRLALAGGFIDEGGG